MNVEGKLDRLLVLREQEIDTAVHPPLKPEYLDTIDVSKILKVEQKTSINGFEQGKFIISKPMDVCCFYVRR